MAYDEDLADRIRELIGGDRSMTERRMFGGLAFLINGNMSVSASGRGGLMVRIDPAEGETLIDDVHVHPMIMRGREMAGWLRVDADAIGTREQLAEWVDRGVSYAKSLPPKR